MFDVRKIYVIPLIAVFLSFFIASLMAASSKYGKTSPSPGQHLRLEGSKEEPKETSYSQSTSPEGTSGPPAVGVIKEHPKAKPINPIIKTK